MLWREMQETCTMLVKASQSDSEGGFITTWNNGEQFNAAVVLSGYESITDSDKEQSRGLYTITTERELRLGDAFRRADGTVVRCTTDAKQGNIPESASFSFRQCSAKEWRIGDGY